MTNADVVLVQTFELSNDSESYSMLAFKIGLFDNSCMVFDSSVDVASQSNPSYLS
jgi:hypothetical protein